MIGIKRLIKRVRCGLALGASAATLVFVVAMQPAAADPLPVNSGLALWLDASDSSTLTLGPGSAVTEWRDKSGNNHHATPMDSILPVWQSNGVNGRPALEFINNPAIKTGMDVAGDFGIGSGAERTVFAVINYDDLLVLGNEILGTSSSSMIDVGTYTPGGAVNERLRLRQGSNNWYGPAGSAPLGDNIISATALPSRTLASVNGTQLVDEATQYFHWSIGSNFNVGGNGFANGSYTRDFQGHLAEVVLYDRALNRYEENKVGYQLQQKYGLQGEYRKMSMPVDDGLVVWLDAADTDTLTLDGSNRLTQWNDKSGNDHHATVRGTSGPLLVQDGIGDLPALEFTQGDDNWLQIADNLGFANGDPRTMFLVFDYDDELNGNEIVGTHTGAMADVGNYYYDPPNNTRTERLRLRDSSNDQNAYSEEGSLPYGTHIVAVQALADGTIAYADGLELFNVDTLNQHYAIGTNLGIGASSFNGRDFQGRLAEFLLFDRALTQNEIWHIGAYLDFKYDLNTQFVPEPSAAMLLLTGVLGLLSLGRRRR